MKQSTLLLFLFILSFSIVKGQYDCPSTCEQLAPNMGFEIAGASDIVFSSTCPNDPNTYGPGPCGWRRAWNSPDIYPPTGSENQYLIYWVRNSEKLDHSEGIISNMPIDLIPGNEYVLEFDYSVRGFDLKQIIIALCDGDIPDDEQNNSIYDLNMEIIDFFSGFADSEPAGHCMAGPTLHRGPIPFTAPSNPALNRILITGADNIFNQQSFVAIDNLSITPIEDCDTILCETAFENCTYEFDLNACPAELDYGYIAIECEADFEWSFPSGSTALEFTSANHSVIVNATPGIYSVTLTDADGCTEVQEYDIMEDCCGSGHSCDCGPVTDLDCININHAEYLIWEDLECADGYEVLITVADPACCPEAPIPPYNLPLFYTSTNSLQAPPNKCFSWQVRAICPSGEAGEYSEASCYSYPCFLPPEDENTGSINQFEDIHLAPMVYPNPNNGEVFLQMDLMEDSNLAIEIYNVEGKLIKSFDKEWISKGKFSKTWIPNNDLQDGIYFIHFLTDKEVFRKKVVLSRN